MAKSNFTDHVEQFHGKVNKSDKIIHRSRFGKTHVYRIDNPYKGPLAESRVAAINIFREAVNRCKLEMADPERLAYWTREYEKYQRKSKRRLFAASKKKYNTLRGFIIAQIVAQLKEATL